MATETMPVAALRADRLSSLTAAGESAARIRRGDEDAFAELFREHYASLCAFVNSYTRAPDVAEEVVQAIFFRIWQSRESWDPKRGARAYLIAACRNYALDLLRHEQIVARSAETATDLGVSQGGIPKAPDAELEAAELGERLRVAVANLPKRRGLVVVLRWQHQLTNPEIAQMLGISVKGVEIQYSRALVDLRQRLRTLRPAFS